MKTRISNVIAWIGFIPMAYFTAVYAYCFYTEQGFGENVPLLPLIWMGFGAINYVMVGTMRLLPWTLRSGEEA